MEGSSQGFFDTCSETPQGQQELPGDIVHRVPVEILSIIFVFVKETIFTPKFKRDGVVPVPTYKQPSQSPPLLVGAVCKRWRDITLTIPKLWTDIIINPLKPADKQLAMLNEWARRSTPHPFNISIFLRLPGDHFAREESILDEFRDVLSVLRSLAVRWNDIALDAPACFRCGLLNNLEETPPFISLFLPDEYADPTRINLRHPLRPRRLISSTIYGMEMHLEWDRLVLLELENADTGEILHIIRHAQNLTHCITGEVDTYYYSGRFPIPSTRITNRSLIYLQTSCRILEHLILPSLLHLNYAALLHVPDECFDSISKFVHRSSPPLDHFILRCYVVSLISPFPRFELLPGITSLFINIRTRYVDNMDNFINTLTQSFAEPILPRLKDFTFTLPHLSVSSWSLFSRLFPGQNQKNSADIEAMPSTANDFRRPLSQVRVQLTSKAPLEMDKETFLHLSEVRKSGMDLSILNYYRKDVLCDMARVHGVEL